MNPINFNSIKNELQNALQERIRLTHLVGETAGFTLVEGFLNSPLQTEISGSLVIGGPNIPMVAIVGNSSGRMYFFALKAVLPNLTI